jgi:hypothetical protein
MLRKLKFEFGVKLKEAKKEREKKKNLKFEIVQRLICLCMKKTDRNGNRNKSTSKLGFFLSFNRVDSLLFVRRNGAVLAATKPIREKPNLTARF